MRREIAQRKFKGINEDGIKKTSKESDVDGVGETGKGNRNKTQTGKLAK